jgi:hypothetical protein
MGSRFNRVTTVRKEAVPSSAAAAIAARQGAASAASGGMRRGDPLGRNAQAAGPQIPQGSGWREGQRPASAPAMTMRTRVHNYYPNIRSGQHRNANAAQIAQPMRGPGRTPFGLFPPLGARPGKAARNARR